MSIQNINLIWEELKGKVSIATMHVASPYFLYKVINAANEKACMNYIN
jgi:hypothetical protein